MKKKTFEIHNMLDMRHSYTKVTKNKKQEISQQRIIKLKFSYEGLDIAITLKIDKDKQNNLFERAKKLDLMTESFYVLIRNDPIKKDLLDYVKEAKETKEGVAVDN